MHGLARQCAVSAFSLSPPHERCRHCRVQYPTRSVKAEAGVSARVHCVVRGRVSRSRRSGACGCAKGASVYPGDRSCAFANPWVSIYPRDRSLGEIAPESRRSVHQRLVPKRFRKILVNLERQKKS
eukprot:2688742-Prymnesium_polylepis.2